MPLNRTSVAIVALSGVSLVAVTVATTLWLTRSESTQEPVQKPPSVSTTPQANSAPPIQTMGARTAGTNDAQSTGVFINEGELSVAQLQLLRQSYGAVPPKGKYWYDTRSGLYGYWGFESAGYIRPGHDFGTLSPRASNGNTGVFLNGREINVTEALFFQQLFGVVYRGRFWLDGSTGNLGIEGNAMPMANLALAVQAYQQRTAGGGGYHWRDGSGAVISSEGNCTFAAIPGAPVYSTPGCG